MAKKSKKNTRAGIVGRYDAYDQRAKEQVLNAVNYLLDTYGEVSDDWIGSLDMLAINYHLVYTSLDDIMSNGLTYMDRNGAPQRNPALKVMVDSQVALSRLTKELGVSPLSRARLQKNETESETVAQERLLNTILN